jgi:tryptophan synthase alpha chain
MKLTEIFHKDSTPAFIPFIMAGHPNLKATFHCIFELEKLGANAIEIGIPFSDPIADGPINQKAAGKALSQGVHLTQCLEMMHQARLLGCSIPLILFSYYNPILHLGLEKFADLARKAKVDAVLVVDLPIEESQNFYNLLKKYDLNMVFLASPTTEVERLKLYATMPPVFLYYVSRLGVTGIQENLSQNLQAELTSLKQNLDPNLPICVGFGISTPEQAGTVAQLCDGVIIGSVLVNTLENTYEQNGLNDFIKLAADFRKAIKKPKI